MDSHSDREEHESGAKRIKLDFGEFSTGVLCRGDGFSNFSVKAAAPMDPSEGVSPDSDSGYEASTMESIPTPSHLTSPRTDIHESLSSTSEGFHQTPIDIFNLDTSQNSIDADDDIASTISSLSELSGFSELSGQEWKPMIGSQAWVHKQMMKGVNPRSLLMELGVEIDDIPQFVDSMTLWKLIINMFAEPPPRSKLRHVNTLDDVVRLLKGAKNVIVLTGAGVSVSCGIPDFRSRDGIYSRLAMDFPDLPDPQAMFDISYFNQDPRPFYKFARDIYPGKFQPSPCHRFIKLLENHNKLLRNYTQNIDTLEKVAEIVKVIECHGSFATATCTKCSHQVTAEDIRDVVLAQNVPVCEKCQPHVGRSIGIAELKGREPDELRDLVSAGIMKPDIVFFGEGLPDTFHEAMVDDKDKCDLLLVIGSSLKVRPVALIPTSLPPEVPQILINRETLQHCRFDVELLGDCDVIINYICQLLGSSWDGAVYHPELLRETLHLLPWEKDKSEQGSSDKSNQSISSSCSYDSGSPKLDVNTQCKCNVGTSNDSSSSSDFQNAEVISCNCPKQTSIERKPSKAHKSDAKMTSSFKERHMSIDSARDSGIGENSNFTDGNFDEINDIQQPQSEMYNEGSLRTSELDPQMAEAKNPPDIENSDSKFAFVEGSDSSQVATTETDLRGFWQPKQKRSLTERLPSNSFYLIVPSRYIFPGAEVYYDPDEKCTYFDDTSTSSESSDGDDESENENECPDVSF